MPFAEQTFILNFALPTDADLAWFPSFLLSFPFNIFIAPRFLFLFLNVLLLGYGFNRCSFFVWFCDEFFRPFVHMFPLFHFFDSSYFVEKLVCCSAMNNLLPVSLRPVPQSTIPVWKISSLTNQSPPFTALSWIVQYVSLHHHLGLHHLSKEPACC